MIDIHDIAGSLRREISGRKLTIERLAEVSGVHRASIHRILQGQPARSGTLAKMESALKEFPEVPA